MSKSSIKYLRVQYLPLITGDSRVQTHVSMMYFEIIILIKKKD